VIRNDKDDTKIIRPNNKQRHNLGLGLQAYRYRLSPRSTLVDRVI